MTEEARINITGDKELTVVVGGGTLDLTNSKEFHDGLKQASETVNDLTVDLRGAFFIDTAIVQDLANAGVKMMKRGRRLKVLASNTAYPLRVLRISGFEGIMDIEVESVDA